MNQRIEAIFKLCEEKTSVTVTELVERFHVSEATIRRDLQYMEDRNMIKRFYGGAILSNEQKSETSLSVRELSRTKEKLRIAKFAASFVKNGDTVYIDAGSTTSKIIDFIYAKDILVVTQGINNVQKLVERNINCYMARFSQASDQYYYRHGDFGTAAEDEVFHLLCGMQRRTSYDRLCHHGGYGGPAKADGAPEFPALLYCGGPQQVQQTHRHPLCRF